MKLDVGSTIGGAQARRSIPLTGRLLFGLIILTLGLLWTAENLGFGEAEVVLRWWPVLLVVYGLVRVLGLDGNRSVVSGTLFLLAGGWMVVRELGWVTLSIWRLWPVWMIVVGAGLIIRSMRPVSSTAGASADSFPRPFAIMGGVTRSIESQDLAGIEATAVMGGVELDLRGAKARDREVVLEVFAMWGGIEIVVPDDWRVVTEATPIMGGVEDKTHAPLDTATTTLIVRGFVVMGGVELKNKRRESSRQDASRG